MGNDFVCDVIVGDSDFLSVSDVKNTFDAQFVLAGWHFWRFMVAPKIWRRGLCILNECRCFGQRNSSFRLIYKEKSRYNFGRPTDDFADLKRLITTSARRRDSQNDSSLFQNFKFMCFVMPWFIQCSECPAEISSLQKHRLILEFWWWLHDPHHEGGRMDHGLSRGAAGAHEQGVWAWGDGCVPPAGAPTTHLLRGYNP